jgi:hypothetical protein
MAKQHTTTLKIEGWQMSYGVKIGM